MDNVHGEIRTTDPLRNNVPDHGKNLEGAIGQLTAVTNSADSQWFKDVYEGNKPALSADAGSMRVEGKKGADADKGVSVSIDVTGLTPKPASCLTRKTG